MTACDSSSFFAASDIPEACALPAPEATRLIDVRSNGSLYSLLTEYCALIATPAAPNAVAPSRPRYMVSTSEARGSAAN